MCGHHDGKIDGICDSDDVLHSETEIEKGMEKTGLHEPSEREKRYDVHQLDQKIIEAIKVATKSTADAKYLEAVLKQTGIQPFSHQAQRHRGPCIPTPSITGNTLVSNVSLFESDDTEILVNEVEQQWEDIEFEVALDSGSIVNVCHPDDAPGYILMESSGSKRGQNFIVGDGGKLGNMGEKHLNLGAPSGTKGDINAVSSTFQIAKVTRPLMSVGHICDQGLNVVFDKLHAIVRKPSGEEVCRFARGESGLYTAKMSLRAPTGFGRQGS